MQYKYWAKTLASFVFPIWKTFTEIRINFIDNNNKVSTDFGDTIGHIYWPRLWYVVSLDVLDEITEDEFATEIIIITIITFSFFTVSCPHQKACL